METPEEKLGSRETEDLTSGSEVLKDQGQTPVLGNKIMTWTHLLDLRYQAVVFFLKEQGKCLVTEAELKYYHQWPGQEDSIVEMSTCRPEGFAWGSGLSQSLGRTSLVGGSHLSPSRRTREKLELGDMGQVCQYNEGNYLFSQNTFFLLS